MRKTYSREFKIQVCRSIEYDGAQVGHISKQYTTARPIISHWLSEYKRYGENAVSGKGNPLPDQARLYPLEKENEELKEEITILKKIREFARKRKAVRNRFIRQEAGHHSVKLLCKLLHVR